MPRRIKAVLKVKRGRTQYYYGVPNNPLGECIMDVNRMFSMSLISKAAF